MEEEGILDMSKLFPEKESLGLMPDLAEYELLHGDDWGDR